MPLFIDQSGRGVEAIRPRPRRDEMPEGVRRRLGRDAAMFALIRQCGWSVSSVSIAFGVSQWTVRDRVRAIEQAYGDPEGPEE